MVNGKETRNVAQKIYDAIVKFLDKVTGYKSEEAFLRGIKDKFEKAFNAEYTKNGNTKFSLNNVESYKNIKYNDFKGENLNDNGEVNRKISSNINSIQTKENGTSNNNENRGYNETQGSRQIRFTNNGNGISNVGKGIEQRTGQNINEKQLKTVDTNGNKISPKMQEFMKDSAIKVDGKLLNVYHGTSSDFTIFDTDYIGSNSGDVGFFGDGFYFATNKGESKYYGNKNMETYLNIKNPFYFGKLNYLDGQKVKFNTDTTLLKISNLVEMFPELGNVEIKYSDGFTLNDYKTLFNDVFNLSEVKKYNSEDYNGNPELYYEISFEGFKKSYSTTLDYTENDIRMDFVKDYIKSKTDMPSLNKITDIIQGLYKNKYDSKDGISGGFSKTLKKYGYDGIVVADNVSDADEIVAFYPEQIKNITNQNPTNNPDIRYSKAEGKWQQYLEKHKIENGTTTTLGEIKLPEAKKNLPAVSEIQFQDTVNNATYIPKEMKTQLLSELEGTERNNKTLKEFKELINEMDNTYKEIDNDLLKKQTYNTGNKEIYQNYLKSTNEYDTTAIDKAMDLIPANYQGRRTKEQWTNIAKQIGTEISNKSNKEIQEIAFRSWQDLRPNSKESLNKQGQKFVDFNSDNWVNTIYDAVEQARTKNSISDEKNNENIILPSSKKIESKRIELPTNPEIYKDEDVRAFKYATDNIDKISENNNFSPPEPPDGELPDTTKYISKKRNKQKLNGMEIIDSLSQKIVNKGHYIDKLAKETGNKELTYKYDRTLSSFNEAQYSIGEEQVNSKGEVVGKSLLDIFKPVEEAGLETEFEDYLLNKHNISRTIVGKSIYGDDVSAPQSKKIVENYEKKYPQFKEWSEKVSLYNQNSLKDMADTGMISESTYENMRSLYGDYVPTYRDIVDERIIFDDDNVGGNILGKATKSNLQILSPKEAMAEQTLAIKKAIRTNELGVELYKTLGKETELFEGLDFDATAIQTLGGNVIDKATDGTNTFTIFIDGKMTQFKISDDLYTAFSKDTIEARIKNSKVFNALLTPVEKLSKVQRNLLTTYSVGFAFNNPLKDIQDAVFNTKYSVARFAKNYTKALYQIGTKGNLYKQYIRDGGAGNTYFDYNQGLLPQKGIKATTQKVLGKVQALNEVLEMTPRLAEYMSTIEKGGSKAEALYNASEITTNFKRGGEITKAINKYGANFLNASVQGLDKQIRNITGQNGLKGYANLLVRTAVLGVAPSLINHMLLSDDDDKDYYKDLPDYIKDSYYLFPKGDGEFYRIPKGRVLATIGTISRNVYEMAEEEQGLTETVGNSINSIIDNLAPNNPLKENLISPIMQAKNNKAWYGGDIEGTRLQKLPVAERTDEKTSEISNSISKVLSSNDITSYIQNKLGLSPKKIDYVLDQYSGGIGDVILPMATPYAENNIIEDKFTTDSVLKNKKVEEFYSALENAELSKNSEFATDTDDLEYKYLSSVSKDVSSLYGEKRNIENSNLSDVEKKKQVREIQKQINSIVKETLNELDTATITSSTAKFGNIQYYKNSKDEWQKIDEEDIPKDLSTKIYADYKNKLSIATDDKRKEKNKDDVQLTEKEKIRILNNTAYTDKEKKSIYSNILGKNDNDYKYLSKLEDIDINAYLDYKTQDIKADEDMSSNIEGKTISGSKKKNLINYLNSSELSTLDKVYILGKSNKLDNSQRKIIQDAINNSSLTEEEKKEFYRGLSSSNIEELKDGTIRWK